ncbi:hypothetical protein MMC26_001403 [Xylographa opegraphella]|nr:hypothetical protein [Xylographa opegraphella]
MANISIPSLDELSLNDSTREPTTANTPTAPPTPAILSEIQNIATHVQPPTVPAHRSHDPSNNLKRSDPFQFGSRYLEEGDSIFEFNAWDHVDPSTDPLYTSYTAHQLAFQRTHAVTPFDARRFATHPDKWWDKFYTHNTSHFFKDRKWLRQEFPVLSDCTRARTAAEAADPHVGRNVILEVGAGAGNTAFPILAGNENPRLVIHACDFSRKAVELIRAHEAYDGERIRAEVWDLADATETLPPGVEPGSVDVVVLIFVFSALSPEQWGQAVKNVWRALKPGGEVCFRDYGRGDLAQVRFKKGRWLEENFYVRGDGTRVYFFDEEELRGIWTGRVSADKVGREPEGEEEMSSSDGRDEATEEKAGAGGGTEETIRDTGAEILAFEAVSLGVDRRLLVNRQKQLKMYRCWMQGRFRKPESSGMAPRKSIPQSTDAASLQGSGDRININRS